MALNSSDTNPKSELVTFLQRYIGRALTKEDVVYSNVQTGEMWQSTLKLPCHQGEEFAGELSPSDKDAMQSAAAQALSAFSAEIAALPPKTSTNKKKSKAKNANSNPMQGAMAAFGLSSGAPGFGLNGGAAQQANFKTELMQKIQTHTGRPMTKVDIIYDAAKIGDGFQATVKLACCGGQEFVGEVAPDSKLAQQSAAQQALMNTHMWPPASPIVPMPNLMGANANKRKAPEPMAQMAQVAQAQPQAQPNPKSDLITYMQRYLGRTLEKNDIMYQSNETIGGIQSTVQLNCYQNRQFAGEVCATTKLAEASAAQQAFMALQPELGQLAAPAKKKSKTSAGGAGGARMPANQQATVAAFQSTFAKFQKVMGGAGMAGFGGMAGPQMGGPQMGNRAGAGKPQQMAWGAAGKGAAAFGKGQGKAMGAQNAVAPRHYMMKEPILGEIVEWNEAGGFGWIRPEMVINHPEAQKRQGKIYVHKKDVTQGSPIGQGSMVQFRVYTDNKGLGASSLASYTHLGASDVMPF